jgi:hypothetical protein
MGWLQTGHGCLSEVAGVGDGWLIVIRLEVTESRIKRSVLKTAQVVNLLVLARGMSYAKTEFARLEAVVAKTLSS